MVSKCVVILLAFVVAVNCLPAPSDPVGFEHHVVKVPIKVVHEHHVLLKKVAIPIYGGRVVHHDHHAHGWHGGWN